MEWKKKLTRAELAHLRETTNGMTLESCKRNVAAYQEVRAKGEPEPCWTCKAIARKLGLM
ncbi:MAG: hypothetical protein AB9866_23825 [Syntrophobacteraceae bacterium]